MSDDPLKNVDDALVHLAHAEICDLLLRLLVPLLLHCLLQGLDVLPGEQLLRKLGQDDLDDPEIVLLDVPQQVLHLLNLVVGWLQDIRGASIVVDDRDRENLEGHLVPEVTFQLFFFDSLLELRDRVVVFVS